MATDPAELVVEPTDAGSPAGNPAIGCHDRPSALRHQRSTVGSPAETTRATRPSCPSASVRRAGPSMTAPSGPPPGVADPTRQSRPSADHSVPGPASAPRGAVVPATTYPVGVACTVPTATSVGRPSAGLVVQAIPSADRFTSACVPNDTATRPARPRPARRRARSQPFRGPVRHEEPSADRRPRSMPSPAGRTTRTARNHRTGRRATTGPRPSGMAAIATTWTPGVMLVAVLAGTGSHESPSVDVHSGVGAVASVASKPSATNPPRHATTDRTRLSGSSGASWRQRIDVQAAVVAGGTDSSIAATRGTEARLATGAAPATPTRRARSVPRSRARRARPQRTRPRAVRQWPAGPSHVGRHRRCRGTRSDRRRWPLPHSGGRRSRARERRIARRVRIVRRPRS